MKYWKRTGLCFGVLFALLARPNNCCADLIVDISSVQIRANTTSFVDVYVRSASATTVDLAGYIVTYQIEDTNTVIASGTLSFDSPSDTRPTGDATRPYVFPGSTPSDNYIARLNGLDLRGEDSTRSGFPSFAFSNEAVSSTGSLLGRIAIKQLQGSDVQVERGQYVISISESSVFFDTSDTNPAPGEGIAFRANEGTVIVGVPEPGASTLIVIAIGLVHIRRRV